MAVTPARELEVRGAADWAAVTRAVVAMAVAGWVVEQMGAVMARVEETWAAGLRKILHDILDLHMHYKVLCRGILSMVKTTTQWR